MFIYMFFCLTPLRLECSNVGGRALQNLIGGGGGASVNTWGKMVRA